MGSITVVKTARKGLVLRSFEVGPGVSLELTCPLQVSVRKSSSAFEFLTARQQFPLFLLWTLVQGVCFCS